MPESKPRKLYGLQVEGFKRVKLAHLEFGPDGGLALITGDNGDGKTSILDALDACFRGGDVIQSEPINRDSEKCRIRADLGDLIVTRTFKRSEDGTKTTTSLKVEGADGALYGKPQQVVDGFLGKLSFDPLAFQRAKPVEQYMMLRDFVPGVDFDLIERQNKGDFEKRTDINREAKRLRSVAESIYVPENCPRQRVSIDRLSKELADAGRANADREKIVAQQDALYARRFDRTRAIEDWLNEIERLKGFVEGAKRAIDDIQVELAGLVIPDEIDTTALQKEVARANETNKLVEQYARRRDAEGMAEAEEKKAAELTAAIDARKKRVRDAVASAEMPIEGIGFGDGQILYKGLPFDQASDAEQLRVSIAIAMAQNPQLRVIRVRDGSLMGPKSLKIVADMAAEKDFLVICEYVETSGKIGFVMEEGNLVRSPGGDTPLPSDPPATKKRR
jgi:hypothetical protein